jgi:16S rRNA (uracil1498-N3)-methyltransferase
MTLPFFFEEHLTANPSFNLNEDTSRHVIQVLRMHIGEQLKLTNGKGQLLTVEIVTTVKRSAGVKLLSTSTIPNRSNKITIAISLLKSESRFEWFLEKATELGVTEIIPVICERTEKQHFRHERMKKIMLSAMLQSQQVWLPTLHSPGIFNDVIHKADYPQKFIAHCIGDEKKLLKDEVNKNASDRIILIGPEGDFTLNEISISKENNFMEVSLGNTRLRAETAGIYAAVIMRNP